MANRQRLPAWHRDELILALDLYLNHGHLGKEDGRVRELSDILRRLQLHPPASSTAARFRSTDSVSMKLANFRSIDPSYQGLSLSHGSQQEAAIWEEFEGRRQELKQLASSIRAASALPTPPATGDEEEDEAYEGALLYRWHRVRDRDRAMVTKKKEQALLQLGRLECEVCNMNFATTYGSWGEGYIECHHVVPLAEAPAPRRVTLADLILVCANCHRVLHRGSPPPAPTDVRNLFS